MINYTGWTKNISLKFSTNLGERWVILHNCWFSLNNSKMVKAVTLVFCSIQELFIRDIGSKSFTPNSPHSDNIAQNPDSSNSDFCISDHFCINQNCHNIRTSHGIDMKLGSVTKPNKRSTTTSKKLNDDVMPKNCDIIFFIRFMVNLHPFRIWIPNLWFINLTFSLTITFYLTKLENKTQL